MRPGHLGRASSRVHPQMSDSSLAKPLQHDAVVAADLNDEPVPTARARLNDVPGHVLEMPADQQGPGCAVRIIRAEHLARCNPVKLLHHCAGRAEADRKSEERHPGGLLGSDKCIRDGLATEVEDLTKNTAAQTAAVLGSWSLLGFHATDARSTSSDRKSSLIITWSVQLLGFRGSQRTDCTSNQSSPVWSPTLVPDRCGSPRRFRWVRFR